MIRRLVYASLVIGLALFVTWAGAQDEKKSPADSPAAATTQTDQAKPAKDADQPAAKNTKPAEAKPAEKTPAEKPAKQDDKSAPKQTEPAGPAPTGPAAKPAAKPSAEPEPKEPPDDAAKTDSKKKTGAKKSDQEAAPKIKLITKSGEDEESAVSGLAAYQNWFYLLGVLIIPAIIAPWAARQLRMEDYAWKIWLVLFFVSAASIIVIQGWPPGLGIDLKGGAILVYEVDREKMEHPEENVDLDKLIAAVSKRINPGGLQEIVIRPYGNDQIEIIIPDADEEKAKRIEDVITRVGSLEFRILANNRDHEAIIEMADTQEGNVVRDPDSGDILAKWVPIAKKEGTEELRVYPESLNSSGKRIKSRKNPVNGNMEVLVVKDQYDVEGKYLSRAFRDQDNRGAPAVGFAFNPEGAYKFAALTGENAPVNGQGAPYKRDLGVILDGYLATSATINERISERGIIQGDFDIAAVEDIVSVLNAGSLPTALRKEPLSRMVIGPTLGEDTIRKGSQAIAISLIAVLLFMLFYYRVAGVVACGALLLNLLFLLALMISFHAVFTLPGIAGLILTVGMAVDANVLIFERIREETSRGAALRMAIRNGFDRATSAIVDANLTTLITATVLYWIGTDQVKGFAVTLWLGIVLSMFTAIFVSRLVFDILERKRLITQLNMMKLLTTTNIDFLSYRYKAICGSLLLIALGMACVIARGKNILDIDFTGGVSVQVLFSEDEGLAMDQVRKQISADYQREQGREQLGLPDAVPKNSQVADEDPTLRYLIDTSMKEEDNRWGFALTFRQPLTIADVQKSVDAAISGVQNAKSFIYLPGQYDDQTKSNEWIVEIVDVSETQATDLIKDVSTGLKSETQEVLHSEPLSVAEQVETRLAAIFPNRLDHNVVTNIEAVPLPADAEAPKDDETATRKYVLTFANKITHGALSESLKAEFRKQGLGDDDSQFDLKTPGYAEGSDAAFDKWTVDLNVTAAQAKQLGFVPGAQEPTGLAKSIDETPFFPSSNKIGGQVAGSTQQQALIAILFSLLLIIGYLWFRFHRAMFGMAAVVAVAHDVLITLGAVGASLYLAPFLGFALVDAFKINLTIVAAFLTIIGYSLNDTIVIFDRIREVRGKSPDLTSDMINTSINQTLSRTILTTVTTMIVVAILYVGGGEGLRAFSFCLIVGLTAGTYSTIFIASPVLLWLHDSGRATSTREKPAGGKKETAATT